ncbi:hypothetical protein [Prevotella nigrescens]|uniref:hypothetical protein n=1 Tax=Prevotella nigrescens TaxID=28133 RepID=UPI00397C0C7B
MQTIKAWLKKRNVVIFLAQIGIYFMLTVTWCVVVYITERDPWVAMASARTNAVMFFLLLVVFMANFYVLVPYLYEDKSKLTCSSHAAIQTMVWWYICTTISSLLSGWFLTMSWRLQPFPCVILFVRATFGSNF